MKPPANEPVNFFSQSTDDFSRSLKEGWYSGNHNIGSAQALSLAPATPDCPHSLQRRS